jgi:hypothetical protein
MFCHSQNVRIILVLVVYGIEKDPKKGHVFVCNTNGRIQIFTKNGGFIKSWGGHGARDGEFITSSGITVNLASNVFVAEVNRIQKFTSNGGFILKWSRASIL